MFKVVSPVRSDSSLAADVPDVQLETSRLHTFDVETLHKILFTVNAPFTLRPQLLLMVKNTSKPDAINTKESSED